jgi:hypothetical protein
LLNNKFKFSGWLLYILSVLGFGLVAVVLSGCHKDEASVAEQSSDTSGVTANSGTNVPNLCTNTNRQHFAEWRKARDYHFMDDGEMPEQELNFYFVKPGDRVWEFGGNQGRNTRLLKTIVTQDDSGGQLLTTEMVPKFADTLHKIIPAGHENLKLFMGAISDVAITFDPPASAIGYGTRGHTTNQGSEKAVVLTPDQAIDKFGILPEVLVADCEGCIMNILDGENPKFWSSLDLIVLEQEIKNNATAYNHFLDVMARKDFHLIGQCPAGGATSWLVEEAWCKKSGHNSCRNMIE